jgi:hypothetical protein
MQTSGRARRARPHPAGACTTQWKAFVMKANSGWYAAHISAREHGRTPQEASNADVLHTEGARVISGDYDERQLGGQERPK